MDDTLHTLSGDGVCIVPHLDQNEFAISSVFRILLQHSMRRRPAASEGIEDDIVLCRNPSYNSLYELYVFLREMCEWTWQQNIHPIVA